MNYETSPAKTIGIMELLEDIWDRLVIGFSVIGLVLFGILFWWVVVLMKLNK